MKIILALNLAWIAVGFSGWVLIDFIYVKVESFQTVADILILGLIVWPLILLAPLFREIRKEHNRELRDRWVSPVIFGGSLVFQYLGLILLIATIGIGFHFSFGGTL